MEVTVDELEGAEHRKILNNRDFFKKLVLHIGEQKQEPLQHSVSSTLIEDVNDL